MSLLFRSVLRLLVVSTPSDFPAPFHYDTHFLRLGRDHANILMRTRSGMRFPMKIGISFPTDRYWTSHQVRDHGARNLTPACPNFSSFYMACCPPTSKSMTSCLHSFTSLSESKSSEARNASGYDGYCQCQCRPRIRVVCCT